MQKRFGVEKCVAVHILWTSQLNAVIIILKYENYGSS